MMDRFVLIATDWLTGLYVLYTRRHACVTARIWQHEIFTNTPPTILSETTACSGSGAGCWTTWLCSTHARWPGATASTNQDAGRALAWQVLGSWTALRLSRRKPYRWLTGATGKGQMAGCGRLASLLWPTRMLAKLPRRLSPYIQPCYMSSNAVAHVGLILWHLHQFQTLCIASITVFVYYTRDSQNKT